ncbi:MAG: phenylalanine--tRNA ligase subunit alpha [Acidobacteriota bacterium]
METDAEQIRSEFESELLRTANSQALKDLRNRYLSRKNGRLSLALRGLSKLPAAKRPHAGQALNQARQRIETLLAERQQDLETHESSQQQSGDPLDLTLPGRRLLIGQAHPLTQVRHQVESVFRELGYRIETGPEIETDFHNFEALNMPEGHPARDLQDTFFTEGGHLLRTHTSPVQVRTMMSRKPPIRMVAIGRVFRRDSDISHSPMFHQVEGLAVDERVTFADLKGTIAAFCQRVFSPDTKIRLRPSYFPFVEPGAEFDISCALCSGSGCPTCKRSGWIEMGGAGMVHPAVFRAVGYDPGTVSGFAFGLGIDRIAMLKLGINDIRLLFENDLRFLRQFPQ